MVKQKERKNRKVFFGLVALVAAITVIVGVGYAYFSDVITGSGQATAGSLDITGDIGATKTYKGANGVTTETLASATDPNFNPGDMINTGAPVSATAGTCDDPATATTEATCTGTWTAVKPVTNQGNKSAWMRQQLTITNLTATDNTAGEAGTTGNLVGWVWVCVGTVTRDNLIAAFGLTGTAGRAAATLPAVGQVQTTGTDDMGDFITVSGVKCYKAVDDKSYGVAPASLVAPDDVVSGTGANAELDGGDKSATSNIWLPSDNQALTVFFDPFAPNGAQLGNVAWTVDIQALQFRNNTEPGNADAWKTVVSSPYATP